MSVDTLSLAKELRAADFAGPQAEAIAAAIGRAVAETAATKADLQELRAATKADLQELKAATKADLQELRAATKADTVQLGAELRTEIAKLDTKIESVRSSLLFWFIGTQLAIGGLVVALVKLIPAQG
ncbi:MAG: DUF1640 domain-containing protein [Sphingomonadaceae bacterium]|nr:DUF1640 domain-containing protein [Sphingomonadaceae bacterium]